MHNAWLVARREFRSIVQKRSFLASTLAIPGALVLVILISLIAAGVLKAARPVGYVDHSGLLAGQAPPASARVPLIAFQDPAAAATALAAGEIEAYYVLPADYLRRPELRLHTAQEEISNRGRNAFVGYLRSALLADAPPAARQRLEDGFTVVLRSADGGRELDEGSVINIILPIVAGMFFMFAVMMSSGYMLEAVASEKENRTIEVLTTSVSPLQLVGGKALGLMAVVLLQLVIWVAALVVGLIVAARFIPELAGARLPLQMMLAVAAFFVPAYALVAALMTIVGVSVTNIREGQQVSGIFSLLFVFPLFLIMLFFTNPDAPVLVAMTLFPTTAFLTVAMRLALTSVPAWQLILSWAILAGSAILGVAAAARIFRRAMLQYGQPLSLRGVAELLRMGGR